jgi:small-conductance mechanosensitive channel
VVATVGFSRIARDLLEPRTGTAHAAVVRYTIVLAGGLATVIITLELFQVPVGNLLLGGAFTAVLIGIAAQQTLGNLFAGVMLMLARPFNVGEQVRMRAGALGGEIQGTVTDVGITYVRLDTAEGPLSVPNAQALAAVVGPLRADSPPDPGLAADPVAVPAGAGPGAVTAAAM